ncbi:prepilin-type N-terminal cleavage/methylation domain-containing protein [Pseudomarimonas salicorniae]|uniref:Prepilin-type N-terminal cleavage/methylation domain-containing protein n=1 Tax=Pseudomarimonas salicorniae TaxID=2933270 RepID=A0ABT0GJ60_9GAMM|nr:prepilin-type N-terminal cleavage/methylation domain-containing protein [Lysobacter sp. CAU 1642]MCK7594577.1 prepilin-type N-terminal cleavage/methylation domain-containing protein [Lysobacter sp. CAU 1642]
MSPAPHRQHGFTLLEILLSVALLSLVIALAYGSIRVAVQASRSGEALIERTEEARTTQQFLRRQLSQMLPTPYERLEDSGEETRFEGSADFIRFVAPMPGYLSRGGAHVQELALVRVRDGYQLEFRHAQLNGFDPVLGFDPEQEPVVLIDGISDAAFSFRRVEPEGGLSGWMAEWDEPQSLPLMLRLEIEFDSADQRSWPEFEVASLAASAGLGLGMGSGQLGRGGSMRRPPRPRDSQ